MLAFEPLSPERAWTMCPSGPGCVGPKDVRVAGFEVEAWDGCCFGQIFVRGGGGIFKSSPESRCAVCFITFWGRSVTKYSKIGFGKPWRRSRCGVAPGYPCMTQSIMGRRKILGARSEAFGAWAKIRRSTVAEFWSVGLSGDVPFLVNSNLVKRCECFERAFRTCASIIRALASMSRPTRNQ